MDPLFDQLQRAFSARNYVKLTSIENNRTLKGVTTCKHCRHDYKIDEWVTKSGLKHAFCYLNSACNSGDSILREAHHVSGDNVRGHSAIIRYCQGIFDTFGIQFIKIQAHDEMSVHEQKPPLLPPPIPKVPALSAPSVKALTTLASGVSTVLSERDDIWEHYADGADIEFRKSVTRGMIAALSEYYMSKKEDDIIHQWSLIVIVAMGIMLSGHRYELALSDIESMSDRIQYLKARWQEPIFKTFLRSAILQSNSVSIHYYANMQVPDYNSRPHLNLDSIATLFKEIQDVLKSPDADASVETALALMAVMYGNACAAEEMVTRQDIVPNKRVTKAKSNNNKGGKDDGKGKGKQKAVEDDGDEPEGTEQMDSEIKDEDETTATDGICNATAGPAFALKPGGKKSRQNATKSLSKGDKEAKTKATMTSNPTEWTKEDLSNLTVPLLKELLKQHSVKSGGRQNKSEMIEALLSFAKESAASDEAVSGDRNTASICGSTVASSSTTRINKRTADEEASTKPVKILKTTVCQSSQAASEFTANALSIQEKHSEPGSSSSHRTFASTEFSASPSRQVCPVVSSTASSVAIIDPTASSSSRLTVSVNAHQPVMPELNRQISIHPFSGYEEETSSVSEDVREDTADEDEQGQAEYDDFMGDKEMILDSRPGSPTFYV